ncbi:MAG: hypothetical protein B7Z15_00865 [Rhizobiales bacterium 32-66-8]|nr:MAG: hypothetical protein B7Z15_00865 [Rhizobiales bacterium 32-66-8]
MTIVPFISRPAPFDPIGPDWWLTSRGLGWSTMGADLRLRKFWLPSGVAGAAARWATEPEFFAQYTAAGTTRTYADSSGILRADLAAGAPRYTWVGGVRRLALEGTTTNLVTARKHNPIAPFAPSNGAPTFETAQPAGTAIFTIANDSSALAAAGLDQICTNGMVYKIDNSAGAGYAWVNFASDTVAANTTHVYEAYIRAPSGGSIRGSAGSGTVTLAADTSYRRVNTIFAHSTAQQLRVEAGAGQVVYVILPGVYRADYPPAYPVIGDTLSAVTRPIETFRLPHQAEALIATGPYTALVRGRLIGTVGGANASRVIGGGAAYGVFGVASSDPINRAAIWVGSAELRTPARSDSPWTSGFGIGLAEDATGRSMSLNGNLASDAWRAVTPAPHYLGRDGTGRSGDGFYDLIAIGPIRLTNAQLQAAAVPYV